MPSIISSPLLLLMGCMIVSSAAADGATPPIARAGGEALRGEWLDGPVPVAAFRGIPFAAPPVGSGRWRAPAPPVPRSGVQPANRFAPACMQDSGGVDWYVDVASAFGAGPEVVSRPAAFSEDCLYLNVWTPRADPEARLPVMVFVHGGGNSGGWSYEPNYRGGPLAASGAVVATIAYRLGPFGFFAHPALEDGSGGAVANFALLDIRAAFEWLRANAAAFGGDPDRIMAFGESAGAINLVDLLLADAARGQARMSLFRRQISQSIGGGLVGRQDLAEEQAIGVRLAGLMGLAAGAGASELRAVPAGEVLAAAEGLPEDYYPDGVIDGNVLPMHPLQVLASARAEGVRMVLGTNADEWLMYTPESSGERELSAWAAREAPGREQELLSLVADSGDPRRALDRLETAKQMLCPSRTLADWAESAGGHAWMYYFTRTRPGPGGDRLGAYHGAELPYVFGTHDSWLPTSMVDRTLGETISASWLAFADSGDPSTPGLPAWPRYSSEAPSVMEFGDGAGVLPPFANELCGILGPKPVEPGRSLRQQ
jgi:para-nitrobenzyl esterase